VLVTEEAPLDIETVIGGIVTGTRQGELSHLNVRSSSRGTPNCYLRDGYDTLAKWEGQLVAIECELDDVTVTAITPEEAETCWAETRPEPVSVVPADLATTDLMPLLELPTGTADERRTAVGRYGSKGSNLATLYQRINPELELEGFLIPFAHYAAFLDENTYTLDLGAGPVTETFQESIDALLADETFRTDGVVRREQLAALQAAMQQAPCDPALIATIHDQIQATYGSDEVMVRFRSSSNAEDALAFNGAGLYDSTSACLADENDADAAGPSHCDPDQSSERDVCRALRLVWSSLWGIKAFDEREWYGIDQAGVAMGILVDTRTKLERANVVAFTGNPLDATDERYLINAQLGELDVVSAVPGVWPEKVLLTLESGSVTAIDRVRGSTELPGGEWVLDDDVLTTLGETLLEIGEVYPVDEAAPAGARILLDTEWKLTASGQLVVKQIRPFLN
jgi:hypothetical protein